MSSKKILDFLKIFFLFICATDAYYSIIAPGTSFGQDLPRRIQLHIMATFKKTDVGKRVTVEGYEGMKGTIRFVGKHIKEGTTRIGVELDKPVGKNNGTVKVCWPPSVFFCHLTGAS